MLSWGTHLFHYLTLLSFVCCVVFYDRLTAWAQTFSNCELFNISDVSIQKEIRLETISSHSLLTVSFVLCGLVLILTTLFEKQTVTVLTQSYRCWLNLRGILCNFYWMMLFLFVVKIKWGRLRPSFLEACGVKEGVMEGDSETLLDSSVCTKSDFINFYCQSFFSGHACVAWYTCTIMIGKLYNSQIHRNAKVACSIFTILLSSWVCWTRLHDHQHHLTDILCGGLVGVVFGAPLVISLRHHKSD